MCYVKIFNLCAWLLLILVFTHCQEINFPRTDTKEWLPKGFRPGLIHLVFCVQRGDASLIITVPVISKQV